MLVTRCCLVVAAIAALAGATRADVLYVDDDALPGGDGLSWDTALRSLRVALDAARAPGSAVTEVRVAQGTYRPVQVPPAPLSSCCVVHDAPGCNTPACAATVCPYLPECCDVSWNAACVALAGILCGDLCDENPLPPPPTYRLPDGLALRGGYAGLGAPDPDARDVEAYPTVLTGDVSHDDDLYPNSCCAPHDTPGCDDPSPDGACEAAVCADLPYCCETAWDLLCVAEALDPYGECNWEAACPEIANNAQVVTAIDTGPATTLDGFTVTHGVPGVFIDGGALSIVDCTFVDNRIHGVLAREVASTIAGCTFTGNVGTPLVLYDGSAATVTDCLLSGNATARRGGGLVAEGVNTIADCTVSGNRASLGGGGISVFGGTVIDCTVSDNTAGPGSAGGGGRIGSTDVIDCLFSGNEASYGGGLLVSSTANVISCTIMGNTASDDGGGVLAAYSNPPYYFPNLVNCLFIDNVGTCGGGLVAWDVVFLTNCTFSHNTASSGGAVCAKTDELIGTNCLMWGDVPDEVAGGGVALVYSDVQGGFPGEGNIDVDPQFVDPAAADYRLGAGSPCIDAGRSRLRSSNAYQELLCDGPDLDQDGDTFELIPIDRDGQARFVDDPDTPDTGCAAGPVVDMGAYEFGDAPPGERVLYGDLDGDGEADVTDFLVLLGMWGTCADPCCLADMSVRFAVCQTLDGPDGFVDVVDFYALLTWWGY